MKGDNSYNCLAALAGGLAQTECITDFYLVIRGGMVDLVEVLQADVVELGNAVHRFAGTDIVETTLVTLRSSLCLLLEIDNLTGNESVALVTLIVFCQLAIGYAEFVGKAAEGVALAYLNIIVAVEGVNGMDFVVAGMVATMAGNKLVVALCLVVAIELVELDNLYQFVGITGIGGITGSL